MWSISSQVSARRSGKSNIESHSQQIGGRAGSWLCLMCGWSMEMLRISDTAHILDALHMYLRFPLDLPCSGSACRFVAFSCIKEGKYCAGPFKSRSNDWSHMRGPTHRTNPVRFLEAEGWVAPSTTSCRRQQPPRKGKPSVLHRRLLLLIFSGQGASWEDAAIRRTANCRIDALILWRFSNS